jgi:hypothetical protein
MPNDNDDESFTKEFWKAEAKRMDELAKYYRNEIGKLKNELNKADMNTRSLEINYNILWKKLEQIAVVLET